MESKAKSESDAGCSTSSSLKKDKATNDEGNLSHF